MFCCFETWTCCNEWNNELCSLAKTPYRSQICVFLGVVTRWGCGLQYISHGVTGRRQVLNPGGHTSF